MHRTKIKLTLSSSPRHKRKAWYSSMLSEVNEDFLFSFFLVFLFMFE